MKILFVILYYEPSWAYGGPPRLASDVARALAARGHQVTVCTTDALDERRVPADRREEEIGGVRVVRFRNVSNRLAYRLKVFFPLGMRRWLDAHVGEFDVVHVFETRTLPNAWASSRCFEAGVPFVLSVWGSLPLGDGWRMRLKARYDRRYGGLQYGGARLLLAQNAHEAALYAAFGADPTRVRSWPLAVLPEAVATLPERGAFRQEMGIPPEAHVVLFVGRINELKGLGLLLRSFAHAQIGGAHLVVVGRDDGYLAELLALVKTLGLERVFHFAGPRFGAAALAAYVDSDLFAITPTHHEETSLAALTAAACGVPILVNDRCSVPHMDSYAAGMEVGVDEQGVAEALRALLGSPAELQAMGKRARQMVDDHFFLPRVVDQLVGYYEEARGA